MFTAWICSISAPLVAVCALSIVSGSIAPVAQAAPNSGNNSVKLSAKECRFWKDLANSDSDKAAEAYEKGDKAAGKSYSLPTDSDHQGGCAWAARLLTPWDRPTIRIVLGSGGTSVASSAGTRSR